MIFLRIGIFLTFIALLFLTQRFWFMGAWRAIVSITSPNLRAALQVTWVCALIVFVLAFFDPLLGHVLSKVGGGKWIIGAVRLWLMASVFSFLAFQLVHGAGWIYGLIMSAEPVNQSRRNFFRYASYLAGSLPIVAAAYGFATGRLKYRVERVEVAIANLPKELDGFKIAQLSEEDLHTREVFAQHGWIEPGETIEEPFLLAIPEVDEQTIALRLHLRIVSRGMLSRAIEWNAGAVVGTNAKGQTGETSTGSLLRAPVTLHLNRRPDMATSQTQEQAKKTTRIQRNKTKRDAAL